MFCRNCRTALAFVLLAATTSGRANADVVWSTTTPATGLNSYVLKGLPSTLDWAPNGTLGLVYYDFNPMQYQYRTYNGSSWSSADTVVTMSAQGSNSLTNWNRWVDLEYDSSSRPRVAYMNNGTSTGTSDDYTQFAYNNGSGWVQRTVQTAHSGGPIGLHLDSNGDANVSLYQGTGVDAQFARATAASNYSSFSVADVESAGSVGSYGTDIVRDSGGNLQFAYFDDGSIYVAESSNDGSSWTQRLVHDPSFRDYYPSIALDGNGEPAVAFVDPNANSLRFATFDGSNWSTEVAATGVAWGENASLAYYEGNPYVAYIDSSDSLRLAYKESGSWQYSTLASNTDGAYPFLSISSDGNAAVSYYTYPTMYVLTASLSTVPEPSAIVGLLSLGAIGLVGQRLRKRRRR